MRHPEPAQGARELELTIRVVQGEPFERGAKVVVIGFEPFQARGFCVDPPCVTLGGKPAKGSRVTSAQLVGLT